jgi:uncharacterized protein with NRDE domain
MCTVSIILSPPNDPTQAGMRLVVNRDEQRDRPLALSPRWRSVGSRMLGDDRRAIWPTDPKGGGTWVGASDRGISLAILNLNLEPVPALPNPENLHSRGVLIPKLIWLPDSDAIVEELSEMELARFAPFRMIIAQASTGSVAELVWNRERLEIRDHGQGPSCFVSSGLGDSKVTPRLDLFQSMVTANMGPQSQDAFHAHVWPDRPEISVLMSRRVARTVSVTTVDVARAADSTTSAPIWRVRMAYRPIIAASDTPNRAPFLGR